MENVVIIGGGPAGLSAATYNARAGLKPLLFAGSPPGGQLTLTSEVENYPGFDSILGTELVEKMRNQAKKFGTRIVDENVAKVDFSKRPFEVHLRLDYRNSKLDLEARSLKLENPASTIQPQDQASSIQSLASNIYYANSILIATGAKALWLGLESETRLRGKGVSACATCDAFFFKGKTVVVIGGGDTAMEEALTLTKFASKVYIIHRRNEFRASKIMQERVLNNPKVEIIYNAVVEEIMGEKRVEEIKVKTQKSKLKSTSQNLKVDGVFIAIGHKPDTELFSGQIELDSKGYVFTSGRLALELAKIKNQKSKIKTTIQNSKLKESNFNQFQQISTSFNFAYQSATSISGVFAAGDCVDHVYRQAATSVGMGVAAALEIERYLQGK